MRRKEQGRRGAIFAAVLCRFFFARSSSVSPTLFVHPFVNGLGGGWGRLFLLPF